MKEYKKYFIIGTNDFALKDTTNGLVTGELIRCKDCENHGTRTNMCDIWHRHTNGEGFCHRAKAVKKSD